MTFFTSIHGLEDVKQNLLHAFKQKHIAHAQLFLGPQGSANLTLALAYSALINCEAPLDHDACGECPSCIKMKKLSHPDLHFSFPVTSTNTITGKDVISANFLKEWREFLQKNPYGDESDWIYYFGSDNKQLNISREESRRINADLTLKPFEGKYKILLMWLPEFMHPSTANALLKILEEPPGNTVFLLVSNNSEKIIPTILSRTQILKIRAFTDEEIENMVQEAYYKEKNEQLSREKSSQIARLAGGNLKEALGLLHEIGEQNHQYFRDWMRVCYSRDYTAMVKWSDFFQKMGKTAQKNFFRYGLQITREVLLTHALASSSGNEQEDRKIQAPTGIKGEEQEFVSRFSKIMDLAKMEKLNNLFNEGYYHLERNGSPKIIFLDISLNIAGFIK